ncbi:MAG: hypothetical protein ACI9S8_001191 [Chlamydiales bacterium]|jgi:hypothetical protein
MQISPRENNRPLISESEDLDDDLMDFATITPAHAAVVITFKLFEFFENSCERINNHMIQRVKDYGRDCEEDILPSRINQYVQSYFYTVS